jgi:hypothetical protein
MRKQNKQTRKVNNFEKYKITGKKNTINNKFERVVFFGKNRNNLRSICSNCINQFGCYEELYLVLVLDLV